MVQQGPDIVLEVPDDAAVGVEGVLGMLVLHAGLANFLIRNWFYILSNSYDYNLSWTQFKGPANFF